jgi:crotonobetainyl-CoA:carnitine CoA-transferase CaiB-like acyl-CoA transferase
MMSHEQTEVLRLYEDVPHPLYRSLPYSRVPLHIRERSTAPDEHAPLFGEHNRYVFQELLGLNDDEVARLYADGVTAERPEMA